MFPLGGAGKARRRRQPLTNFAFLLLAFKDFYYQMPPIEGFELPPEQIVHNTLLKAGGATEQQNTAIKHPRLTVGCAVQISPVLSRHPVVDMIFLGAKHKGRAN